MPRGLPCIAQLSQEPKGAALLGVIMGQRAHGHQAQNLQAVELRQMVQKGREFLRRDAALLGLPRTVDLNQDALPAVGACDSPVELGGKVFPVERMNQREPSDYVPRLIALQRADQVPLGREPGERVLLLKRLLHPVLADVPKSRSDCRLDRLGSMRFGDTHHSDGMLPPTRGLAPGHRFTYYGQPGRKAWEVHNPLIYRGMLGYCRAGWANRLLVAGRCLFS